MGSLTPTELQDEGVVQLSLLAQSPGWGLYKARLQSLVRYSEGERDLALRTPGTIDPRYSQGKIDGLRQAAEELDRWIKRLQRGEARLPEAGVGGFDGTTG